MAKVVKSAREALAKLEEAKQLLHKEEIYVDGNHEYDYVRDNLSKDLVIHTLYYSNSHEWADHIKTTIALELIDNGNGMLIKQIDVEEEINYLQIEQLHILLRLSSDDSLFQIAKPAVKTEF